jgi:uroporphyrinogen-III decarboxylase
VEPDLVAAVLGPICEWYAAVTEELCKLDFDFIWAADDIAYNSAPFFSPKVYRELLLPHTRKVAEKITKPWIYHSDGNLLPIWDDLTSQGMNAIHPLEAGSMDLAQLKADYGGSIVFVGGLDLRILEAGTPEETRRFAKHLIDTLGPDGYCFGSSNSITPNVKPENFRAMIETLLAYG